MPFFSVGLYGREKALEGPGAVKDNDAGPHVFQKHAQTYGELRVPVIGGVAGPEGRNKVFRRKAHALHVFNGGGEGKEGAIGARLESSGVRKTTTQVPHAGTVYGEKAKVLHTLVSQALGIEP